MFTNQVKTAKHVKHDKFHYGSPTIDRPKASEKLILLGADNPQHIGKYGQQKQAMQAEFPYQFQDIQPTTTAAAAKTQAPLPEPLDPIAPHYDDTTPQVLAVIHEDPPSNTHPPSFKFNRKDILNIEMSADIYGPSSTEEIDIHPTHPTLGFDMHFTNLSAKPTIKNCKTGTPAARIKHWRSKYRHGTIRAINGIYVDTIQDIQETVTKLKGSNATTCTITIAHPEIPEPLTHEGIPQLHFDQLHMLAHHLHVLKYGDNYDLWDDKTTKPPLSEATIHQAIADGITPAKLTWLHAEWKELDSYDKQNMFGEPVPRPRGPTTVLPFVWTYLYKDGTTEKARGTCNGGKKYGKAVTLAHTYAACIEQPASRIFWALSAIEGMTVIGADAGNAFAEAPAPKDPFYMQVDTQFHDWWTKKMGRPPIPDGYVLPVRHAMQGHPESPRLWEHFITKILEKEGFTSTTHEKCIYHATISGQKVLFLRQVDDFAVACKTPSIARALIERIGKYLSVPLHDLGIISKFNGINIQQSQDFIKISCEDFIDRVLDHHQWHEQITQHNPIPMRDESTYLAQLEIATPPTLKEQEQLRTEFFNYRQVIGEAIYAMTVARPDISPAVIKLAQYSNNPAKIHYQSLRILMKYLALTKTRGIYFWRNKLVPDLPKIQAEPCISTSDITDDIPHTKQPRIIHGYVDSDWGSDRSHRRSVTGIAIMLGGGVICYKTKYQPTVALSSTEAEFAAACEAGKQILYLRSILFELGYPQYLPTILYEDNKGALHMANASRPTKRTRHMDMKHFALQDWTEHDLLTLKHIATKYNCSDTFTKALGRIKFYEQTDVLMGCRIPRYAPAFKDLKDTHNLHNLKNISRKGSLHDIDSLLPPATAPSPSLRDTISSLLPTCTWLTAAAA